MRSMPGSFEHCSSICNGQECNQAGSDGQLEYWNIYSFSNNFMNLMFVIVSSNSSERSTNFSPLRLVASLKVKSASSGPI